MRMCDMTEMSGATADHAHAACARGGLLTCTRVYRLSGSIAGLRLNHPKGSRGSYVAHERFECLLQQ